MEYCLMILSHRDVRIYIAMMPSCYHRPASAASFWINRGSDLSPVRFR
jgi:hypothetical protein